MTSAGQLLAEHRKSKRLSQLDLGLMAEVSARHISFIETGRAKASRDMLLRLAEVLELPYRESNLLLTSAGYAPVFSSHDLEADSMRPVREALDVMLQNHEPFPAVVIDAHWNVLRANRAQQRIMLLLMRQAGSAFTTNSLLELLFDENLLRPAIANWEQVAVFVLRRFRRQLIVFPDSQAQALFERMLRLNPPAGWQTAAFESLDSPMVTLDITLNGQLLRLFSTLSSFGTALDVGMQELLVESYFPADEQTRQFFVSLGGGADLGETA